MIVPAPRRTSRRWLLILPIIALVVVWKSGVLPIGASAPGGMPGMGGAMPAGVAEVISRNVTPFQEFSGRIEAVRAAEIRPRVAGQIVGVHFNEGGEVKQGDLLFTVDPRPYEAERLRAKGALATAQSAYTNAAQELTRAKALIKESAISQSEFDQRMSAYTQAEGAVASARGALASAEVNLGYAHITAPISGKISRAEITVGNNVEAAPNAPLLASIVQLAPIYASFEIDEQTYLNTIQGIPPAKLKQIPAEVILSGGSAATPIVARIHDFDNQIAPGSGTLRVRVEIANKDQALVPGLFATVRIGTPDEVPAILINPAAIGTDQNKKFVLAVGAENKAEYREVTLGTMSEGLQMITSGLKQGDQIIVGGLQMLRPGAPIQPIPSDMVTLKPLAVEPSPEAAAK